MHCKKFIIVVFKVPCYFYVCKKDRNRTRKSNSRARAATRQFVYEIMRPFVLMDYIAVLNHFMFPKMVERHMLKPSGHRRGQSRDHTLEEQQETCHFWGLGWFDWLNKTCCLRFTGSGAVICITGETLKMRNLENSQHLHDIPTCLIDHIHTRWTLSPASLSCGGLVLCMCVLQIRSLHRGHDLTKGKYITLSFASHTLSNSRESPKQPTNQRS